MIFVPQIGLCFCAQFSFCWLRHVFCEKRIQFQSQSSGKDPMAIISNKNGAQESPPVPVTEVLCMYSGAHYLTAWIRRHSN